MRIADNSPCAPPQEQLGQQCLQWLEDQVFSIREAATHNLQQLAQEFGSDWAKEHLVPQVSRPQESSGLPIDSRPRGTSSHLVHH